jgi:hypothetical protein
VAYDVSKRPAEWVSAQAQRRVRRVWALVAAELSLLLLAVWASLALQQPSLAVVLLAGMVVVYRVADRQGAATVSWVRGAHSEAEVGAALNILRAAAFIVMHDIEQSGEGNIDHLVSGPTGVYLIETKRRRYESGQLRKARRQAAKLGGQLGVWVTPVICLEQRRGHPPYRHEGVWIVGRDRLTDWLQTQHNPRLALSRLAAFADRL